MLCCVVVCCVVLCVVVVLACSVRIEGPAPGQPQVPGGLHPAAAPQHAGVVHGHAAAPGAAAAHYVVSPLNHVMGAAAPAAPAASQHNLYVVSVPSPGRVTAPPHPAAAAAAAAATVAAAAALPLAATPAPMAPPAPPAPPAPVAPHPPRPVKRVLFDARGETHRPLVFFWNIGNMHWNMLRVRLGLHKEIELFEPMGKPKSRNNQDGISLRSLPHSIIQWLDYCYPVEGGWLALAKSAIKLRHQLTGFDCGVACLLYAEKCGQGMARQDIQESTNQAEITEYRGLLQRLFATLK